MPPKLKIRTKQNFWTTKQKKQVKFRLMEISLKVDDYIYKNKPISDSTAESYIQEVTYYKALCNQDPRSLQVIEKLIRCMKGIISEGQEFNSSCCKNSQDAFVEDKDTHMNTPSPVYSVTDEDKMYMSQKVLEINPKEDSKMLGDSQTIDLCSDNDIEINFSGKGNYSTDIDVHIEKAISNLSVQEVEIKTKSDDIDFSQNVSNYPDRNVVANDLATVPNCLIANTNNMTTDVLGSYIDCSQTILLNYNDNYANNANKDFADQNCKAGNQQTNTVPMNKYEYDNNTHSNNHTNVKNSNPGNVILATNISKIKIHENNNSVKISRITTKECINEINFEANLKMLTNKSSGTANTTNEKSVSIVKVPDKIKQSAPKKKRTQKKKVETNSCKKLTENVKTTKPKSKPKGPSKVKDVKANEGTKFSINRNDLTTDSVPIIYTRNVELDLSWIENIRYVRVHTKEHDDQLMNIEDSFWENYTLPALWDDQDFKYTV